MTTYPCRSCGKPKEAKEVMTRFKAYYGGKERVRWRMCNECRMLARKKYRSQK